MLLLKLMGPENSPDSDSRKTFRLVDGVSVFDFQREPDGKAYVTCLFADGSSERYDLLGNAYIMNADGHTVASFGSATTPHKSK